MGDFKNSTGIYFVNNVFSSPNIQKLLSFRLVLLQVTDDLGTTLHLTMDHLGVLLHGERSTCCRFPNILLIIVVLADHTDLVRDKVARVEANAKLTNHGNVAACSHGLHE